MDGKQCLSCLPGYFCIKGEKHKCQDGSIAGTVASNCSIAGMVAEDTCSKGFQCSDPSNPQKCEKGTFNDLENQKQERLANIYFNRPAYAVIYMRF